MFWKKEPDMALTWEASDGRKIAYRVNVLVESMRPQSKGVFGIKKTPSNIGWMPNGIVLNGVIVGEDVDLSGKTIKLMIPGDEILHVKNGDQISLGIVDNEACIEINIV